jgi:CubicO group peptidase (beta-lactamase class C family)
MICGDRQAMNPLERRGRLAILAVAALIVSAASVAIPAGADDGSDKPAKSPPPQAAPAVTKKKLEAALDRLPATVRTAMRETGVPGIAVAVVWRNKVVFMKGFGVREAGKSAKVGPDTVFELASVSKPLASTVVSGVVGQGKVSWDDPVVEYLPGFALGDPFVTEHVTLADLFSHRSGLPEHAGDLLEDLGYDRQYVLDHLRLEPLTPFRDSYAYTNFGLTAAGEAAAVAAGSSWEDLSAEVLYEPLGMTSTSSRFEDYENADNKALTHVKDGDEWAAKYTRDADAQSPAGGASSTVRDLAKWVRLQLAEGKFDGEQVVDADALAYTHLPQSVSNNPPTPAGRTGFYGLGWNVGYDALGRITVNHSGAFALGAATNVSMLPTEKLGIIVLTNAAPIGVAEAIAFDFFDDATYGSPQVDWLGFFGKAFASMEQHEGPDYSKPPVNAAPAQPDDAYAGTYSNDYYGPLTVTAKDGGLVMQLGPDGTEFPLTHFDGNTLTYETTGENATGLSGVIFTVPEGGGPAASVRIEALDKEGLGTFTRG